jgi:hypothetical protein
MTDLRRISPKRQVSGNEKNATPARVAAGVGAEVEMLRETVALPFPAGTCAGLKTQFASGGRFEHEKLTGLGNVPDAGATPTPKLAACPAGVDPLSGLMAMVKSKLCSGSAEKLTGVEWLVADVSVPVATIVKL